MPPSRYCRQCLRLRPVDDLGGVCRAVMQMDSLFPQPAERERGGERRGFLTRYHSRTMTLASLLPTKLAFERLLLAETLGSNV